MSDANAVTPRVFIFRHVQKHAVNDLSRNLGETDWAKIGRYTGVSERELTDTGIAQVKSASAALVGSHKVLDPDRLAYIYVSPRKRATKTFELLLPSSGDFSKQVGFTEDIAEWDYGDYEGMKKQDIEAERKSNGLDTKREWDIWADGCEGGESPQQVAERLDRLIDKVKGLQRPCMHGKERADVLVVAHGLILRAFVKRWIRWSLDQDLPMEIQPGGLAVLSYKHNNADKPCIGLGLALP